MTTIRQIALFALLAFGVLAAPGLAQARDGGAVFADLSADISRVIGLGQPAARPFAAGANYRVCFTPGQDCAGTIVAEIAQARRSILVQAYSFTSKEIAEALLDAARRGVKIEVVLDKSQRTERYTGATFLTNAGIPVVVDEKPAIAHNKVIIIDDGAPGLKPTVITGSFNFSKSAQERNAENVIVLKGDADVAQAYARNFRDRQQISVPYERR